MFLSGGKPQSVGLGYSIREMSVYDDSDRADFKIVNILSYRIVASWDA